MEARRWVRLHSRSLGRFLAFTIIAGILYYLAMRRSGHDWYTIFVVAATALATALAYPLFTNPKTQRCAPAPVSAREVALDQHGLCQACCPNDDRRRRINSASRI